METSDHVPCVISIATHIPRKSVFRFENFWLERNDFLNVVQQHWVAPEHIGDAAKTLTAKFKNLRKALKIWKTSLSNLNINITNVKLVLSLLSIMEEFRDLSLPEWNFKNLLEQKLQSLLRQQKAYWKQRAQIKWVTLADASTKFFHAHATIRYRNNLITTLEDDLGNIVSDHQQKEKLIWDSFKDRLGVSGFTGTQFDLSSLLHSSNDLSSLCSPFTTQEIDQVVKALPSDKTPGPDGFNSDFVKRCWPIICHDFYNLCYGFYDGNI